jgi:hypothetical protein
MAITRVDHGEVYYTALSTDDAVVSNNFHGLIGYKVYLSDTKIWKVINDDMTLSDLVYNVSGGSSGGSGSSSVTINDAVAPENTLKVNSDGSIDANVSVTAQIGELEIKNDAGNPVPTSALDGGISTVGLKADSAMTVSTNPTTVIGGLKGIFNKLSGIVLGAGSAIIGKVGIDQTAGQNTITIASGQNVGITGTPTVALNTGSNVVGKVGLQVSGADVSTANPVSTTIVGNTALLQGNVTLTGTAQQLPATACRTVTIQAEPGNTANVYIGKDNTVSGTVHMFTLAKGDKVTITCSNLNLLYVNGTANDGICYGG